MKVHELLEVLLLADKDAEIIMQEDAEGNGYSPLSGADLNAVYVPETTWYGTVYPLDNSADDNCMDEEEWATVKAQPLCVVLFPVS